MTQGWGAAQLVGALIPGEAGRVLVSAHIRQPRRRLVRGQYTQRPWGMFILSYGFSKGWVSIGGYEAPASTEGCPGEVGSGLGRLSCWYLLPTRERPVPSCQAGSQGASGQGRRWGAVLVRGAWDCLLASFLG